MKKNLPLEILTVLDKIFNDTKPISIFLYGSQSQDNDIQDSDFDIGIIYNSNNKISRQELAKYHNIKKLKIYPFTLEEIQNKNIDTPFPKNIYLKNIIKNSVLIKGNDILKTIKDPVITKIDLLEQINFCLGRAFSAILSCRNNDLISSTDNFTKSIYYGFMVLIFLKKNIFITSYKQILKELKGLKISDEHLDILDHANQVRNNNIVPDSGKLYKNISFLNFVRSEILK